MDVAPGPELLEMQVFFWWFLLLLLDWLKVFCLH